jgi:hypothetical protein
MKKWTSQKVRQLKKGREKARGVVGTVGTAWSVSNRRIRGIRGHALVTVMRSAESEKSKRRVHVGRVGSCKQLQQQIHTQERLTKHGMLMHERNWQQQLLASTDATPCPSSSNDIGSAGFLSISSPGSPSV